MIQLLVILYFSMPVICLIISKYSSNPMTPVNLMYLFQSNPGPWLYSSGQIFGWVQFKILQSFFFKSIDILIPFKICIFSESQKNMLIFVYVLADILQYILLLYRQSPKKFTELLYCKQFIFFDTFDFKLAAGQHHNLRKNYAV